MAFLRALLLLLICSCSLSAFAQSNAFTDGLSWVSGNPVMSAQSPVYSSPNCQDIHYTIATTSSLGFEYNPTAVNGSGVLFPAYSNSAGNTMYVTITFNMPVSNFGMRILDLDEDNQHNQGPAEEYIDGVTPQPGVVVDVSGINPIFLSGTLITPDDGSTNANNNAGGWVYWNGTITTVSFMYHRYNEGYEFVLDSLHFECPCPAPQNYIDDAAICQNQPHELDATTGNASSYEWSTGSTAPEIAVAAPGTYWVRVLNGSCLETDTAVISLIQAQPIDFGNDTSLCTGQSLVLTVEPALNPVTWQDGTSGNNYTASTTGTYYATAVSNTCIVSDTIVVLIIPYPQVDLGGDTTICTGTSLALEAPPGYSYAWSNGTTTQDLEATTAGTIWVIVANGSCATSDTLILELHPLPPDPLPADTVICSGDTVLIVLDNTTGASYEWNNGSTENSITATAGAYWVESTLNGCQRTDTLHITNYPAIAGNFAFDSVVVICEDKSALIGPVISSPLIHITWENGSTGTSISINDAGTYYFTVSTPCESHEDSIRVKEEKCFCTVYLPNAFTPDSKYGNEVFAPVYACALDSYELLIFNRWGELVFAATDPDAAWDGTYKDLPVPDGVYVYKLTYISAETQTYKELAGHVCVLR